MSKGVKRSVIIGVIVILIFAILYIAYDSFKAEPVDANDIGNNILDDSNTGLDNIINDLFDNTVTNEVDNTVQSNSEDSNKNTESTEILNGTVSSKEQRAVELVKEDWGTSDGVYFSNMGIDSNGRYIVAVCDSATTKTLAFYKVNVENETVTRQ